MVTSRLVVNQKLTKEETAPTTSTSGRRRQLGPRPRAETARGMNTHANSNRRWRPLTSHQRQLIRPAWVVVVVPAGEALGRITTQPRSVGTGPPTKVVRECVVRYGSRRADDSDVDQGNLILPILQRISPRYPGGK